MRTTVFLLLVASSSTAASLARAAEESAKDARARTERSVLAVEGSAGIGTPLGWLGAGAVIRPFTWLDIHGGGGLGTEGVQVEAGARGRMPIDKRTFLGLGASWSSGAFVAVAPDRVVYIWPDMSHPSPPMRYFRRAHFLNFEVSAEQATAAFRVRPFLGVGVVLDPGDGVLVNAQCTPASCPMNHVVLVPYAGVSLALPVL